MKVYMKTFGCQMNVHDSERIEEILMRAGFEMVEDPAFADVALVNSCTVREKAWHKAISEAGRLRKPKERHGRQLVVGMLGCVAQQEGERIFSLVSGMDLVVAPDHYHRLPALIRQCAADGQRQVAVGFDAGHPEDFLALSEAVAAPISAFVTVMKGCEERCLYCIVPSVRGPERHRPLDDIEGEVRRLVAGGTQEVTLLGQKVNAWREGEHSFADLLARLDNIEGLLRLRFTSPHPRHMSPEVARAFGSLRTLCEAIHLPAQSGSDRTLKRMRRRYRVDDYLATVTALRAARPDIAISTDLIVGYPGETEEDFAQTLALVEAVRFSGAFSFKYSVRPGTPAEKLGDDVSEAEKASRLSRLHEVVLRHEQAFRAQQLGRTLEVLVEGQGRMPRQWSGRARNNQIVNFTCPSDVCDPALRGQLVRVAITRVNPNSLEGEWHP